MTDSELFNYAIAHYHNPSCKTAEEFAADYNTTMRIKKLINRKLQGEDISCRLLLNHIMTFYNVFSPTCATVLLFKKLPSEQHPIIKTCAVFLNYLPDDLSKYNIALHKIDFDADMVEFLRSI